MRYEDLPQVLEWRNSEDVRPYMDHREIISINQHLEWFNALDNENNYYFIANREHNPFGVYHIKDINRLEGAGEVGWYLISHTYWGSGLALPGSLALIDFAFEALNLKKLHGKGLKENTHSLRFAIRLGFIPEDVQPREDVVLFFMTRERFQEHKHKLMTFFLKKNLL